MTDRESFAYGSFHGSCDESMLRHYSVLLDRGDGYLVIQHCDVTGEILWSEWTPLRDVWANTCGFITDEPVDNYVNPIPLSALHAVVPAIPTGNISPELRAAVERMMKAAGLELGPDLVLQRD